MVKFKNIAVLIDAENVSANKIDQILTQISEFGHIGLKYVYGDFKQENLAIWDNISLKYLLKQIHTPSLVKGKNSSDIALVIDAMDLLFHGYQNQQFDCFCLVSSDSDFSSLAKYIRHQQKSVIGIGRNNTLESFKMACDDFIIVDYDEIQLKQNIHRIEPHILKQDTILMNAIRASIKNSENTNGWANYSQVNNYLNQHYPNLKVENYGYSKWRILIEQIDLFDNQHIGNIFYFAIKKTKKTAIQPSNQSNKSLKDTQLINILKKVITEHLVKGWANYSQINSYLNKTYPKIKPQHYGYSKWRTLIKEIDLFEIKTMKSGLYIREKSNDNSPQMTATKTKINNQALLDDILQAINESNLRTDEWVHIGYLGSQLKNKGYNPKDFGFKSFSLLFENTNGILIRKNGSTVHITLADKSKIQEIEPETNSILSII